MYVSIHEIMLSNGIISSIPATRNTEKLKTSLSFKKYAMFPIHPTMNNTMPRTNSKTTRRTTMRSPLVTPIASSTSIIQCYYRAH
jgi:hypothetical protein